VPASRAAAAERPVERAPRGMQQRRVTAAVQWIARPDGQTS
jgi:hypothetical protein